MLVHGCISGFAPCVFQSIETRAFISSIYMYEYVHIRSRCADTMARPTLFLAYIRTIGCNKVHELSRWRVTATDKVIPGDQHLPSPQSLLRLRLLRLRLQIGAQRPSTPRHPSLFGFAAIGRSLSAFYRNTV